MGMSSGSGGHLTDINVTPLVDVCLVLLIIFMVMTPRNVPELSVRVPPESQNQPREPQDTLVLGLNKEGSVTLNRNNVEKAKLGEVLTKQLQFRDKKVIFVNFDDDAAYGDAVEVLDIAKQSGARASGAIRAAARVPKTRYLA